MTRKELELLTDISDFATLSHMILKRESFAWLEPSIRYGNCNMVP